MEWVVGPERKIAPNYSWTFLKNQFNNYVSVETTEAVKAPKTIHPLTPLTEAES
jgi:hypothetical protein